MRARVLILLSMLLAGVAVSAAAGETVRGTETSGGRFAWEYAFDAGIEDHAVRVEVAVNWVPVDGVSRRELETARKMWVEGILRTWDNRYALAGPDGTLFPIRITVSDSATLYHHEVIVRRNGRGTDELNWSLSASGGHAAHEFGHMLGAFDEYPGGALASGPASGQENVMAGRPDGETFPRHYEKVRLWYVRETGIEDIRLVPVSDGAESMKGNGQSI